MNINIGKISTAIDRLLPIWKSDPSDKIKWGFFKNMVVLVLLYGYTTWTLMRDLEKKSYLVTIYECYCFEQILEAAPYKTATVWLLTIQISQTYFHNKTCWILLVKWRINICSQMDSYTWTHQCWPTSKDLHSYALCGHWMLLRGQGMITNIDRWWKRVKGIHVIGMPWWGGFLS